MKYSNSNSAVLIKGGKDYFDKLVTIIQSAKKYICLQTYIYDEDDTGKLIAASLEAAAKRNVHVYIIVDGYASQSLSNNFKIKLSNAGVHLKHFEPIFKSKHFYFGRRMHQKVVIADSTVALVGGVNISNKYNDMPNKKAWLDFAVYLEGDIVIELCKNFWKTWKDDLKEDIKNICELNESNIIIPEEKKCNIRMRVNDWVDGKNQISRTYFEILRKSKKEITILCSYFIPGQIMRNEMLKAVRRGVDIKIIIAGNSDVQLAKNAERWLYDWMLRNKIQLFEYQNNVLHGKIAVSDDEWVTIGSYNINNISAYASLELNTDIKNHSFAKNTKKILDKIINEECLKITSHQHLSTKNIFKQFWRWLSYQSIRMIFILCTFYFKQRH